jgi:transketolase
MRSIPGMTVICPADGEETRQAVRAVSEYAGPVYLRLGRLAVAPVSDFEGYRFEIGRAVTLRGGNDVTIAATGIMVQEALRAADALGAEGIRARVVNIHTVKPLDEKTILDAARETGAIVTAEEHNVLGGLGGAVAEVVAERFPVPVVRVGARDTFGRSGDALQLMQAYGLTAEEIVRQCKVALALKG